MIIKLTDKNKLIVNLSPSDMEELGVTAFQLCTSTDYAPEVISEILEKSKMEVGFEYIKSKMYVEIYPTESGGCTMYFTAIPSYSLEESCINSVCEPSIFTFTEMDDAVNASIKLFRQYCHRIFKSSLFKMQSGYALIIYPLDCAEGTTVNFLKEYAAFYGEGEACAAHIREHGTAIIIDNAIDKLAYYLSDN